MAKSTKITAHYQGRPQGNEQCQVCTMFVPQTDCTAVEGPVNRNGWCEYYAGIGAALTKAARETDKRPSEAQKEAGNYRKGKVDVAGLQIAIENPKGSTRSGVGKDGKPWRTVLPAHYGYVRGTEGRDGDAVDVYIGPDHKSTQVFVVDQIDAHTKRFDEHKALLSYPSKDAALADYKRAFSDGKGGARIGAVSAMSLSKFRDWVQSGATKRPLGS